MPEAAAGIASTADRAAAVAEESPAADRAAVTEQPVADDSVAAEEPPAGDSAAAEEPPAGDSAAAGIATWNPFAGNRLGIDGVRSPAVEGARVEGRVVAVEFADGDRRSFHHQWLRHSCCCRQCGDPADGIRFCTVAGFGADIEPARVAADRGDLIVTWPDGHISVYGGDWLLRHAYESADRRRRFSWRPITWRAELAEDFPTVQWADASGGGSGLLGLYRRLRDYGIVRVTGAGADPEATERLAALIGPVHETTVYGRVYDVQAEPVAKLGAKTGMAQAPHIDDAFYYSPPGIDVFHCLANVDEGGASTYADGFAVAESMAAEAPGAYRLLTTAPIGHVRRHPGEIDLRSRGPLISLDERGRPCGIRYFDRALAPLDADFDAVEALYDAIRQFSRRMNSAEFTAEVRVAAGEGVLIDNHRVMHGRTAFDPAAGRRIRLCHVPRDEFHGRLRELARALDPDDFDLHLPQGSATAGPAP